MTMKIKKTISLLCEGDTEYNYFTGFKTKCDSVLNIQCVSSDNGSYPIVLDKLKKINPQGTVARFAIIDLDRYVTIPGEQKRFYELIQYCNNENKKGNPTFLVVSNPDFDHFVLSHTGKFNWKNKTVFITKHCNYKNLESFKNDKKVFFKFNPTGNEYIIAINNLNKNFPVRNEIKYNKNTMDFDKTNKVIFDEQNLPIKTSNIEDLIKIL